MLTANYSTVETAALRKFFAFIVDRLPLDLEKVLLVVEDLLGHRSGGLAAEFEATRPGPLGSLYQVSLALTTSRSHYPYRDQHVPEVPAVTLESIDEEILLVMAHEFRHIYQFQNWPERRLLDYTFGEIDAETFAIQTLEAWRRSQAKQRAA